jgi:hypothetical protein
VDIELPAMSAPAAAAPRATAGKRWNALRAMVPFASVGRNKQPKHRVTISDATGKSLPLGELLHVVEFVRAGDAAETPAVSTTKFLRMQAYRSEIF